MIKRALVAGGIGGSSKEKTGRPVRKLVQFPTCEVTGTRLGGKQGEWRGEENLKEIFLQIN